MSADQIEGLLIAVDDLNLDLDHATAFAMLDHLQVMPSRLRLFLLWWKTSATWLSLGHFAPSLDHRFSIGAFPISGHRRWSLGMTSLLQLLHQLLGDFFFRLGDAAPDVQPGVGFERRTAPEGAALVFFGNPFFSPLWPT